MDISTQAIISILMFGTFLGPFGGNMILPMFGPFKEDFHVQILLLGALVTFYMLPFSFVQLFAGILSDMYLGRRLIIVLGLIIYSAGAAIAALSPNIWILLGSRVIQGVGNALLLPILLALVGDIFEVEWRGKVMGLLAISTTLGATLGPLFGGYISLYSWRLGFIIIGLFALLIGVLSYTLLPTYIPPKRKALVAIGVLWQNLRRLSIIAIGILGFILFFTRVSIFTYLSDILTISPYKLSEVEIGRLLSLSGVGGIVSGGISGYLTDRLGRKRTAIIGLSLLTLLITIYTTDLWYTMLPILLFTQGFTATMAGTPISTMAVEINPENRAIATSIYGSMRFLGYALAPPLTYPFYILSMIKGVAIAAIITLLISLFIILGIKSS
jgi:ACDE family multidrug resistance protein